MNEHNNFEPNRESQPAETFSPSVWIGSLADYNAGRLHGEWLDAAVETDELQAGVNRILASSLESDAEE